MSVGLIALLDDVAAIAKAAAASIDDIAAHTAKASTKSAGIVIDDAAVTPGYVVGFSPERELPMILRIAIGSIRNKMLILLPAALLLEAFAPWALTPLLMIGGLYLVYEGAEKIYEKFHPHEAHEQEAALGENPVPQDPHALEEERVASAIKTDLILSAEIMALTLTGVTDTGLVTQAIVLAVVGLLITVGVYGVVAFIVKADDIGVRLAARGRTGFGRAFGRGLVVGMPHVLTVIAVVGTAAMLWVGGGILLHGLAEWGLGGPEHAIEAAAEAAAHAAPLGGITGWLVTALGSGIVGLAAGFACIPLVGRVIAPLWSRARRA